MHVKGLAIAMGVGVALGAVGILTLSKTNPTRKLAAQAAEKVEDAACKLKSKMLPECMD